MLIQLAVDRRSIEDVLRIAEAARPYIDVLEIGTSYIKDYGMSCIRTVKAAFPDLTVLADLKTCDEAEYEFRKAFEAGADIATVMGSASFQTVSICCETAKKYSRRAMIDLLECPEERIARLTALRDAIFCVHISKDSGKIFTGSVVPKVLKSAGVQIAAAGGVTAAQLPTLAQEGIRLAIIGSAIAGAEDVAVAASVLRQAADSADHVLQH